MVTDLVANFQAPFSDRLRARSSLVRTWLCVGLDPSLDLLPAGISRDAPGIREFCVRIVDATRASALCYKINFAFFEAAGVEGWRALADVRRAIPADIPVIADAKRGDIPGTMAAYAHAIFDELDFDAVTLNPYLGWDALHPFLHCHGRAAFVLARTSNPGAGEYQDLSIDGDPLFLRIARKAATGSWPAETGVVAGATDLDSLGTVRALDENLLILVPGVGAQGASARDAFTRASNSDGENALITVSRSIIFASSGSDFEAAAAAAAESAGAAMWRE